MADMCLGSTQGAVDSLLGKLTSVLADEARLLSGVRADVHFIKDEMESMNGFLLHVAEASAGGRGEAEDHGVRAWMKQVAEVAYASQNCFDLYARINGMGTTAGDRGGVLFFLRRLPRLVSTLPTRHRIAVQIKELKVRSREVGERRLRYGVEAPPLYSRKSSSSSSFSAAGGRDDDGGSSREQEDARRRALAEAQPAPFESFSLVRWMTETEDVDDGGLQQQQQQQQATPRVIALVGTMGLQDQALRFAKTACLDPWVASSCSLDCVAIVQARQGCPPAQVLRDVLAQLQEPPAGAGAGTGRSRQQQLDARQLVERIRLRLRGRRFLLLLHDVPNSFPWGAVKHAFLDSGCAPGSAILITTQSLAVAYTFVPSEIYDVSSQDSDRRDYLASFYLHKAVALVAAGHQQSTATDLEPVLRSILEKLVSQTTTCSLFIHALYTDPSRTIDDLKALRDRLVIDDDDDDDASDSPYSSSNQNQKQILLFLYNGLPSSCKNCLLYLSIFPERTTFRRARLVRRWAAEGTVTRRGRLSALDQAERCFDMLVARRLVTPKDTDATGRIKSCAMDDLTHEVVIEVAREADFASANLPPELAHRISIRNAYEIQQQQAATAAQQRHMATSSSRSKRSCWNRFFRSSPSSCRHRAAEICKPDAFFLHPIPLSSTQLGLLQVLDLEDCMDFKDHHLKHICNHVFQLKYLSLRNTGIKKLPNKLGKLRYLETLDIRQTKVCAFPKNSILLPKLKHLLAGVKTSAGCRSNLDDRIQEQESLHTIQMPKNIGSMTELQVLSHVAVSDRGDELIDIGNLLQLRKLGLVLNGSEKPTFRHLFHAIGKLSRCLQSLSIRIISNSENLNDTAMEMEERLLMPPKNLRHLHVSGMVNGLTDMVKDLRELTKITIHKTFLTDDDIKIIGRIPRLSYLRFRQESFCERTLTFSKGGFQNLKCLVIDCLDIVSINFDEEATPRLEKIIWSSTGTQCRLTGIENLPNLKELHLTGNFDNETVQQAIASNINNPILKTHRT